MSSKNPGKKTTFLTSEEGRAPSAYHVDDQGLTQRARQEHRSGPTVTGEKKRLQAFTTTKSKAHTVAKIVSDDSERLGITPQVALRLAIMDGLASPLASHGAAHLEASSSNVGRGNPHVSGGTVTFPKIDSPLADFENVVSNTRALKAKLSSASPPIKDSTSSQLTPEARKFNTSALAIQASFVKGILKG